MQLLVQFQFQALANRSMFLIHPIQELRDSSGEHLKFIIELRPDHVVMTLQLVQVDGGLHHFCEFTELVFDFLQDHEETWYRVDVKANLQFCEILLLNKLGVFKGFGVNAFERSDEFRELLPS